MKMDEKKTSKISKENEIMAKIWHGESNGENSGNKWRHRRGDIIWRQSEKRRRGRMARKFANEMKRMVRGKCTRRRIGASAQRNIAACANQRTPFAAAYTAAPSLFPHALSAAFLLQRSALAPRSISALRTAQQI